MVYIVSFPRSGNTFMRYIVEAISDRPTLGVPGNEDDAPIHTRNDQLSVSNEEAIARKSHWWRHVEDEITADDKLLIILRNYKECIVRHTYYQKGEVGGDEKKLHVQNYMKPLEKFDSFNGEKELVRYEDLINNTSAVIEQVSDLFGFEEDDIRQFTQNLDTHVDASLSMYDSQHGSYTGGEKANYHAKKISDQERQRWDELFRERSPEIYDKYLDRYSE